MVRRAWKPRNSKNWDEFGHKSPILIAMNHSEFYSSMWRVEMNGSKIKNRGKTKKRRHWYDYFWLNTLIIHLLIHRAIIVFQIKSFIGKLLTQNIEQDDIGVITPYHAQMLALRKGLKSLKKVRVGTVEEFQGEEKMVIVFSAVKTSGLEKALQFIFCPKRLNTAISRARWGV